MSRPLTISLIAPIYGVERYIAKFADSVLSQSYPHIEFIFVNDGTKDRSIEILDALIDEKYSHLSPQIKIIHKENGGLPAARKTGLEHATGDYIWHIDSDDWIAEGAVERIAEQLAKEESDVLYFDFYKEYEDRCKLKRERDYNSSQRDLYIHNMFNHRSYASVWNKCIKRTLYTNHELFHPKYGYAEDCYLVAQLVGRARTIKHLAEPLYHYRKGNPLALTRQSYKKRKREDALNFIDLYQRYVAVPEAENPLRSIIDQIPMRVGVMSILYGLGLFAEFKWLSEALRHSPLRLGTQSWIVMQIVAKIYATLHR